MNIDLCFTHERGILTPDFSAFFQRMDEFCDQRSENGSKRSEEKRRNDEEWVEERLEGGI
jgi:hypothetical protein